MRAVTADECFGYTNILLRSVQPSHPLYLQAIRSVATLLKRDEAVCFCPQTIAEFYNGATRPSEVNGLGFTDEEVWNEIENIEGLLTLLPDTPSIYVEWKRLVTYHQVRGVKVFDARSAAVANVYGVGSVLTFNAVDFKRYSNIAAIEPASLL